MVLGFKPIGAELASPPAIFHVVDVTDKKN